MTRRPTSAALARRAATLLLLGLATTIALAWLLAALVPHTHLARKFNLIQSTDPAGKLQYVSTVEFRRAGMARRAWAGAQIAAPLTLVDLDKGAAVALGFHPLQDRSWGRLPRALALGGSAAGSGLEDARGFPFLALWCSLDASAIDSGIGPTVSGGLPISPRTVKSAHYRALPLMPIWPGLLADTILFALAWSLAIPAYLAARRALRRRRGRCPACAYNLNHNFAPGCPECGWNRLPTGSPQIPAAAPRAH